MGTGGNREVYTDATDARVSAILARPGASWGQSERTRVFEWLLERTTGQMIRDAYRVTGSLEEAQDMVQETMVALVKGLGTYDPAKGRAQGEAGPEGLFRAWVKAVHRNTCTAWARRRGRWKRLLDEAARSWNPAPPPVRDVIAIPRLRAAIDELSHQQRTVVLLRLRGLTHEEISQELYLSKEASRKCFFDAQRKLRQLLNVESEGRGR